MLGASLTRGVDSLGAHPGVVDLLLNDPVEDLLLLLAVVDHPPLRIHNTESRMVTCLNISISPRAYRKYGA